MKTSQAYLKSQNAEYIDELFQRYLADPNSVDESWRFFFDGLSLATEALEDAEHDGHANGHANGNGTNGHAAPAKSATTTSSNLYSIQQPAGDAVLSSEAKVSDLINRYREAGHLMAHLNPLSTPPKSNPRLELQSAGLTEADLSKKFTAAKLVGLSAPTTLKEILDVLNDTYCRTVGVEFAHITNPEERGWLEREMERTKNRAQLSPETKKRILSKLTVADGFERFVHTRFVGAKRFSVEGGDALIPMLDAMIEETAESGATDMVMGMAHRGRLNVLTNIFGKKYENVFFEFDGNVSVTDGEGDVKYHMGFSSDHKTSTGKTIHLSLASNPSHLEFVNPVVEGMTRAKQFLKGDIECKKVVPVAIHGDAAFAGQGVVYETIQLSGLKAYNTGGTIHLVINNQVGFTTNPEDARSTLYSTDLAKMLESPIFHVNGDDAEACTYVAQFAARYRQRFHKDIVIDLVCYRKYGHNEGDEPSFTQPLMYKKIKEHATPRELYARKLAAEGVLSAEDSQKMLDDLNATLTTAYQTAKAGAVKLSVSVFEGEWKGIRAATEADFSKSTKTAVEEKVLKEISTKITTVPNGFTVHPKLVRLLETRRKCVEEGKGIDWGTGEALAFGSLVVENTHVRLTGQDSERGTFSHRHSVLYDFENGASHTPLNHIKNGQGLYEVYNSALSETAVLGFEFGYSTADPKALTIWEAQFGDFGNGAQVIIDQFLAASESKWQRMTGLVLLLPHGYEGQGPEHSSARLERFLQLCGKLNMQVANLTTPAQIFHALRRQVRRDFRKPLIVMSPKSLLRHPQAVSTLDEFSKGKFQEVIDDPNAPAKPKRVVLCSGKVYYDLADARDKAKSDVAIVRVEQLYPWPHKQLVAVLKNYTSAKEVVWVQEEPKNMGSWHFVRDGIEESMAEAFEGKAVGRDRPKYIGRGVAAAPAVGSHKMHEKEQKALVEEAIKV